MVGREAELARIAEELRRHQRAGGVFVHGPGGVGKTALLRRAAETAVRDRGFAATWLDGRDIAPAPDELEDALAGARSDSKPLIVIDSFEHVESLGGYLRRALLPSLPRGAAVLIGSRRAPGPEWQPREDGGGFASIELRPLDSAGSMELLGQLGVNGEAAVEAGRWARGNPLALELGADSVRRLGRVATLPERDRAELGAELVARLVEARLQGPHLATLAVAAIARVTTPDLLAATLTGADPNAEWEWLCSRSFVEPRGEGAAPHELVREAIRAGVDREDPILERELRRLADHLYERAAGPAGPLAIIDLAELAHSPALRWGFSWAAAARYRVDGVREGDLAIADRALEGRRHAAVWEGTRRIFEQAPEHVTVARDGEDRLCGVTVTLTPATAAPVALADPILGPRIRHARELGRLDAVIWRDMVDLSRDPEGGLFGLLGMAGLLAASSASPRHAYLPINPALPGAREFAAASGGHHVPELDVVIGAEPVECHVIDWGPGGLVAAQREHLYRELGLAPPPRPSEAAAVSVEGVRDAFRNLHEPVALARSPLASGEGVRERSESVREALADAVEAAFGDAPGEVLTQTVLRRGYLQRAASHEAVAEELHMSRAAYFRRLRRGCERVARYLSASAG
ncbi:MAG TPA: ATP-binding protein [Solirubrobacterales bacterium]